MVDLALTKTEIEKYRGSQGKPYTPPSNSGFTNILVLYKLYGRPLSDMVLAYIHGLKPTWIRVVGYNEETTTDHILGRVTVYLAPDEYNCIDCISQEVECGFTNGQELSEMWRNQSNRLGHGEKT